MGFFFQGDEDVLNLRLWWWLHILNILKTSDLDTFGGWVIRHVNYISIEMFLRSTACKINDKQDSGDVFEPSFAVRHFFCVRFNFHKLLENAPSKELLLPTVIIGVYRAQKNLINGFHYFPKNLKGLWHRLVQARLLDVLSSCCQQRCPQPVHEESSQDAELTHKTKPLFFTVMTSSDIILGTTKWEESMEGGWHTCSLSVYRFFASDLSAVWLFHWTCPGPGRTLDTAVKSGSRSAGLSAILSSWWPTRTSSSSSRF